MCIDESIEIQRHLGITIWVFPSQMRISVGRILFSISQGSLHDTPICGASNLRVPMYGKFEGFPMKIVHWLGWCHIMTPVSMTLTFFFCYPFRDFFQGSPKQWDPLSPIKRDPYHSHTSRDSYGRSMGMGVPLLGVPEISRDPSISIKERLWIFHSCPECCDEIRDRFCCRSPFCNVHILYRAIGSPFF